MAMNWQEDPLFDGRREAIDILHVAKSVLDEGPRPEETQAVLSTVYRALFLSFGMHAVNREIFDDFSEMIELRERLGFEKAEAVRTQDAERANGSHVHNQLRTGIKSRLRNARPEPGDREKIRAKRARDERRFAKFERQGRSNCRKREMLLASGRWISRTDLNPRRMSLFT
jgi:hypothetical protein